MVPGHLPPAASPPAEGSGTDAPVAGPTDPDRPGRLRWSGPSGWPSLSRPLSTVWPTVWPTFWPTVWLTVWNWLTAAVGAVMGLLPHLLHHAGLVAGAALVTGTTGNLLFGAAGLLLSAPLLRRLYRRFGTWKAPASALVLFAGAFAVSAFLIGPAISDPGTGAPGDTSIRSPNPPSDVSSGPSPGPSPSTDATADPTAEPTADPTADPTAEPTAEPTADPTADSTADPTADSTDHGEHH